MLAEVAWVGRRAAGTSILHRSIVHIVDSRGVHPPGSHDAFYPPVSDFPPVFEIFLTFWKISEILPFPEKISYFHPPKFLMIFLVIDHKFRIPPCFACFTAFP